MPPFRHLFLCLVFCFASSLLTAQETPLVVSSLTELALAAVQDHQRIKLRPGVYQMKSYLTDEVLADINAGVDRTQRRPPVPMFVFRGSDNHFDLRDVVLEIDTSLYTKLPQGGYTSCLIVAGNRNTFEGLTIRNTGPQQGSNGNILSIAGGGTPSRTLRCRYTARTPTATAISSGREDRTLSPCRSKAVFRFWARKPLFAGARCLAVRSATASTSRRETTFASKIATRKA